MVVKGLTPNHKAKNNIRCYLLAKFATNASGAMLLPNLVQVMESISGSVVPLAMFLCVSWCQLD